MKGKVMKKKSWIPIIVCTAVAGTAALGYYCYYKAKHSDLDVVKK